MNSPAAPVIVDSDLLPHTLLVRLSEEQKRFVTRQARAELRSVSNYLRSLVVEAMSR
jgi:hypothetical protein